MSFEPGTTQSFSIYVNGAKVGTMTTTSFSLDGHHTAVVTDAGGVFTLGRPTTGFTTNVMVPTDGQTSSLRAACQQGKILTVQGGIIDGDVLSMKMVVSTAKYDSDVAEGKQTGEFAFIGFEPDAS